jgi:hypothetical protein
MKALVEYKRRLKKMKNLLKLSLDLEDWLKEMGYECAKETALALVEIFSSAAIHNAKVGRRNL